MIGKTVSHYQILEKLGDGGMGVVYKAYDSRLNRYVALKFLSSQLSHNENAKNRFIREAQAASALDHPNICNVHEIDQTKDGQLFICMTWYEGETLRQKIQDRSLEINEVSNICRQLAQGLSRAHREGIYHRDLKPANIMLNLQGELKIVDFGLAKLSSQQDLTKDGTTLGTVAYMSPEQTKGQPSDQRTDIWSFGVILYELLTGEVPFKGDYDQAILYSILNEQPESVKNLRDDVPNELSMIVTRCLMKNPKDRYSSIDDIVLILEKGQKSTNLSGGIYPSTKLVKSISVVKKYRHVILLFIGLMLIFITWKLFLAGTMPKYLVVLPFQIIREKAIDEYYRNGILEIINSRLTQLEQFQNNIWVISGAEVRSNKLSSIGEARDLVGADLVITGSITNANGNLRFTLNLVDANSFVQLESTDLTVDSKMTSVAESKIIDSIVMMLNLELGQDQKRVLYAGGTNQPDAHNFYASGRGYLTRREEANNLETAISLFKKALSLDSTYLLVHTGLGEAYWRKYEKTKDPQFAELAKISCQKAIHMGYKYAEVNTTCGIIYRGIGEYEKAIKMLNEALKLDPDNATALTELGLAYLLNGNLDLSRITFEMAVEKRPGYWQGHSYLGYYYYSTGDYEKAVKQYQQIVDLIPHSDVGYKKLAATYFHLDDSENFINASQKAIEIKPSYGLINNLAVYYYYSGDYNRAVSMFKEVLKFNVKDYLVYGNIATASYYSNQKDSALVYYRMAIKIAEEKRKINPRDNILLSNLAGYYVKLNDRVSASLLLDEVIKSEPKNTNVIQYWRCF
jgi:serine/threonine-protein kinase